MAVMVLRDNVSGMNFTAIGGLQWVLEHEVGTLRLWRILGSEGRRVWH